MLYILRKAAFKHSSVKTGGIFYRWLMDLNGPLTQYLSLTLLPIWRHSEKMTNGADGQNHVERTPLRPSARIS